jgi:OmpA-OmpF porin, OOP family
MKPISLHGSFFLVVLAFLFVPGVSFAQSQMSPGPSLNLDQLAPQASSYAAKLSVACGDLKKSSCALVLPHIGQYALKQGLTLAPVASLGSVQSAHDDVCSGTVPVAIGMTDGFDSVRRAPGCASPFTLIGHPLFPYFGYLIVSNSVPVSTLDELLENTLWPGQTFSISIGKTGTGGQITFANILASNATYRRFITTTNLDRAAALDAILHHQLGGYFVMDGAGSPAIAAIANATDAHGNPLFKFLSINPGSAFYALKDADGHLLYHQVQINTGFMGIGSTSSLSTNAVMIVNQAWARDPANAQALNILTTAANRADASIRAATHTPANWDGDASTNSTPSFVVLPQSAPSAQQLIVQLKPADITPPTLSAPPPAQTVAQTAPTPAPPTPAPPATPPATPPTPAPIQPAAPASTNLDINFASGSATLLPDDMALLDNLGAALTSAQLAGSHFKIVGHTDTVGDPGANLLLSVARAQSVATYIETKFHVPAARLLVSGVGEADLLVETAPQTPNPSNRRVEIINLSLSP